MRAKGVSGIDGATVARDPQQLARREEVRQGALDVLDARELLERAVVDRASKATASAAASDPARSTPSHSRVAAGVVPSTMLAAPSPAPSASIEETCSRKPAIESTFAGSDVGIEAKAP